MNCPLPPLAFSTLGALLLGACASPTIAPSYAPTSAPTYASTAASSSAKVSYEKYSPPVQYTQGSTQVRSVPHSRSTWDVAILLGQREMRDSAWGSVSDQLMIGLNGTTEPDQWPIGGEVAIYGSWDDSYTSDGSGGTVSIGASTLEISLGLYKSVSLGKGGFFRPYIGGGGSLLRADLEQVTTGPSIQTSRNNTFGLYGRVGILFQIMAAGHLGIDYRVLTATGTEQTSTFEYDSDYSQVAFIFGASF